MNDWIKNIERVAVRYHPSWAATPGRRRRRKPRHLAEFLAINFPNLKGFWLIDHNLDLPESVKEVSAGMSSHTDSGLYS